MHITFNPQRSDSLLVVSKLGDTLTINGVAYDFSVIPDGATLPSSAVGCASISGDVERIGGILHITLVLPHGPDPTEDQAFPQRIISPADGELELPNGLI